MFSFFKWYSLLTLVCLGCAPLQHQMIGLPAPQPDFDSTFSIGRAYEMQGNVGRAQEIYGRLLGENSDNHKLHHRLGVIAVRQGRLQEASAHFDQARQLAPTDAELLTDVGYTLYLQGKYDDAERHLREVVAGDPGNKRAANNLGMVLAKMGHGSEAYRFFRKTGGDAQAHSNLAYVYASTGQLDLAEHHYSRALDYDDSLEQASKALLQLDGIRQELEAAATLQAAVPAASENRHDAEPDPQQHMENPDSTQFAAKWRGSGTGQSPATRPETFQFRDDLYESDSAALTTAAHSDVQGHSAGHRKIRQTSGNSTLPIE